MALDPVSASIINAVAAQIISGVFNLLTTAGMTQAQIASWVDQQRQIFYSEPPSTLPKPPAEPTEKEGD